MSEFTFEHYQLGNSRHEIKAIDEEGKAQGNLEYSILDNQDPIPTVRLDWICTDYYSRGQGLGALLIGEFTNKYHPANITGTISEPHSIGMLENEIRLSKQSGQPVLIDQKERLHQLPIIKVLNGGGIVTEQVVVTPLSHPDAKKPYTVRVYGKTASPVSTQ